MYVACANKKRIYEFCTQTCIMHIYYSMWQYARVTCTAGSRDLRKMDACIRIVIDQRERTRHSAGRVTLAASRRTYVLVNARASSSDPLISLSLSLSPAAAASLCDDAGRRACCPGLTDFTRLVIGRARPAGRRRRGSIACIYASLLLSLLYGFSPIRSVQFRVQGQARQHIAFRSMDGRMRAAPACSSILPYICMPCLELHICNARSYTETVYVIYINIITAAKSVYISINAQYVSYTVNFAVAYRRPICSIYLESSCRSHARSLSRALGF